MSPGGRRDIFSGGPVFFGRWAVFLFLTEAVDLPRFEEEEGALWLSCFLAFLLSFCWFVSFVCVSSFFLSFFASFFLSFLLACLLVLFPLFFLTGGCA